MKQLLSIVCATVAVVGCVNIPPAPTGPGTGYGSAYIPLVAMDGVDPIRYDNDVSECRTQSLRIATRSESGDDMWMAVAAGLITVHGQGIAGAAFWTGITAVAVDMSNRPDGEVLAEHQQMAIVNCMSKRGYRNLDTNVRSTFYSYSYNTPVEVLSPRRTGVDTYNVETLAKASRCNMQPRAELTAKGPGYEAYNVPCENGSVWAVRCEFGKCRVLAPTAIRRS